MFLFINSLVFLQMCLDMCMATPTFITSMLHLVTRVQLTTQWLIALATFNLVRLALQQCFISKAMPIIRIVSLCFETREFVQLDIQDWYHMNVINKFRGGPWLQLIASGVDKHTHAFRESNQVHPGCIQSLIGLDWTTGCPLKLKIQHYNSILELICTLMAV